MVFRDFPLPNHASAALAAAAGRCAAAQGQFWPMHDRLFATHGEEWGGVPKRDQPVMVEFAGELGLDTAAFAQCLDDPATAAAVQEDVAGAIRLGINSTPNFLVNGRLLKGALPLTSFQQLIEQEQQKGQ